VILLLALAGVAAAQRKPAAQGAKKPAAARPKASAKGAGGEDAQKSELEEIVKTDDAGRALHSAAERVERLQAFVKDHPNSAQLLRAEELLTSARAALGDEKLRGGDRAAGVELFRAAVAEAPEGMSDKLFAGVVSQLPANLYVLGERDAALELARAVEARVKGSAQRLLTVASFYLGIEQPDEAARVAQEALALQPDLAAAHQVLGTAYRYALRLDDAATEFARAVELDPKSASARHTLAELRRATGKPEDALTLYREQLAADPQDANARSGLVLALFDAGRREEAERELQSALTGEAKDLPLLVGASYWYSAHGEGARALELAEKAVGFEQRFGWAWARIAQGRALLALKRPLEAEVALRAARRFGNFPTLDYELAAALASSGLYDEAAETLSHSFRVRDGQIETRLAGRIEARAADFNDLLAPERRASLSQFASASTAAEAKTLKALLAFRQAAQAAGAGDEKAVAEAARQFAEGSDEMSTFRNLYAADRLELLADHAAAFERAEGAIAGVESALDAPTAPVAIFADTDEVRALRQQTVETGTPLRMLNVQRDVLSKVLRGRIEELAGWALYNQGQSAEAVVRLRRAVSVLPEHTQWWRTAEWRLGAALEATGGARDALAAYARSYREQPDPTRRTVIEALYKRLNNGSTEGLNKLIGTPDEVASAAAPSTLPTTPASAETPTPSEPRPAPSPSATPTPSPTETLTPTPTPSPTPEAASTTPAPTTATPTPETATPSPSPTPAESATTTAASTPSPTPAPTPSESPSPTPTPAATQTPTPATPESTAATPTPSPLPTSPTTPEATPTPEVKPTPTPEATPTPTTTAEAATAATTTARGATPSPQASPEQRPEPSRAGGACALSVSDPSVEIKSNGGSATVTLKLENYTGKGAPRVNPSTENWADIIILAEPHAPTDGDAMRFTISSVSSKTGSFNVTFSTPCGKQDVTVNVK
jgi:tetratricopeptide (TPR) repeat protein